MSSSEKVAELAGVFTGTVQLASVLKAQNLVNPAPGSKAETERAAGFTAGRYRPLIEAYSMSETRPVAAASYLLAIASVVQQGTEMVHAIASLSRTALETSARVAWLLDPRIDGRACACRGIAELMYAFREETKIDVQDFPERNCARLEELTVGATSAGFQPVSDRRGGVLHFGERRPDATEVIKLAEGPIAEIVYRDLSGVAHGSQRLMCG